MSFSSSMDECAPVQFLPASAAAAAAAPTFRSVAAQHAAESSPLHSRPPSPQDFAAAAHCNALASSSSSHRQCIYAPQPQLQFSNFSVPAPAASPPPFAIVAGWAHVAGNMFHCPQTRTSSAPRSHFPHVYPIYLLRVFISMNASFFTPSQSCFFCVACHLFPDSSTCNLAGAKHICDMNCEARQWCPIRSMFVCAISGKVHTRGNPFLVRESKRQSALVDDIDDGADECCATADANAFGFEREGQIHGAARRKFM